MLVFGVSVDPVKAQAKFAKKHTLGFPLLSDESKTLVEALGIWVEKSMYGKSYMGVDRSTFLVGTDGKIEKVWEKVKPDGHALEVSAYLNNQ